MALSSRREMTSYIMQPDEISIGIICPLPIEVAAMIQMLDERYSNQQFPRDPNLYHLGCIGEHRITYSDSVLLYRHSDFATKTHHFPPLNIVSTTNVYTGSS
jgi:hypothetical protein